MLNNSAARKNAKPVVRVLLVLYVLSAIDGRLAWGQNYSNSSSKTRDDRSSVADSVDEFKSHFSRRGISLDGSLTQFYQGIVSGSGSKAWQYGGKGDLFATIDSEKLGLWRRLYFNIHQEWLYGEDANELGDGSVLALNTAMTFPRFGGYNRDTSINVTQDFGSGFTLSVGKFNLLDAVAKTPIIGGGGLDTFMNLGLAAPITGVTPPYLLGSIASFKTDSLMLTAMVYDPRNAQDHDVLKRPFSEGVTTSVSAALPIQIAGLSGSYGLRGVYSTQEGVDFNAIPGLLLAPASRSGGESALTKKGYWYVAGTLQQFLWHDVANPRVGWGFFAEGGVSDGNPNPVKWHAFAGFGGNSPLGGRQADLWGIGYYTYSFSPELTDALSILRVDIKPERGIEVFYNYALTSRVRLTGDIQWIDPGRAEKDDAVIAAMRLRTKF
jgi:porin